MLKAFRRILDDFYEHTLRILREKDTSALRLQASVQTGAKKRTPVWTAFITHQLRAPAWASYGGPGAVVLADLQQFIFTTDYNPQRTSTGKAELAFIKTTGMTPCLVDLSKYAN